jgi:hypothetical protein
MRYAGKHPVLLTGSNRMHSRKHHRSHRLAGINTLLLCLLPGWVHAGLLANNDHYSIPANGVLFVEPLGVLDNDTLDDAEGSPQNVTELVETVELSLLTPPRGNLTCPGIGAGLCADGSFEYSPPASGFEGSDSFTYRLLVAPGTAAQQTAQASVTLSACSTAGTVTTCWNEGAFFAALASVEDPALPFHVKHEGFEGLAWQPYRSVLNPDGSQTRHAAASIVSKGIRWQSNHIATNGVTTSEGPALTGVYGVYDPDHGQAANQSISFCNDQSWEVVPEECRPYDGFSGSSTGARLFAVGGYLSGTTDANIFAILDGVAPGTAVGRLRSPAHQFFGVIDSLGFDTFEFREIDGKTGQQQIIFGDDFYIATTDPADANRPPSITAVPNHSVVANGVVTINLAATDADDDSLAFSASGLPAGARLTDYGDNTARLRWFPAASQTGSHTIAITATDNGYPALSHSIALTILVTAPNTPPVLASIGARSIAAGEPLNISLNATDADADNLVFSMSGQPATASLIDNGNGSARFSWTPTIGESGHRQITFSVADDGMPSATDSETVTITIEAADTTAPVINLLGIDPALVETGAPYLDAGATAVDDVEGVVAVTQKNPVNSTISGTYTVTYSASDSSGNTASASRTVVVADSTPPVITLNGSATIHVEQGTSYEDPGASAMDSIDGPVTVTASNPVDGNLAGVFDIIYQAVDSSGNIAQASREVHIRDTIAPLLTVQGPNPVTVAQGDPYNDAGATAHDSVDGTLAVTTLNAVDHHAVGEYLVQYSVADAAGNSAQGSRLVRVVDLTAPVISLLGPGDVVLSHGDPYVDAGATAQDNQDGDISSLIDVGNTVDTSIPGYYTVTYNVMDQAGNRAMPILRHVTVKAIEQADQRPLLQPPRDIRLPASGYLTEVDLGLATAFDAEDGELTPRADDYGPFIPGRHQVIWRVIDRAGDIAQATQRVDILPRVDFQLDQQAEAGATIRILLTLNGNAPAYPVTVNYNLETGASSMAGQVIFDGGKQASIDYRVAHGGAADDIVVRMLSASNAVPGTNTVHTVRLVERNVEPVATLAILQNGDYRGMIARDAGPVTVRARVNDANTGDRHVFDWSGTHNALIPPGGSESEFIFDPATLSTGDYRIALRVNDDGEPALDSEAELYFRIIETRAALDPTRDTDHDGRNDNEEGDDDDDHDGIPNYADGIDDQPELLQGISGQSKKWVIATQPGLSIRLGKAAQLNMKRAARINRVELERVAGIGTTKPPASTVDDDYRLPDELIDFSIHGLTMPGQSVLVVIPQTSRIPADAVYRKYNAIDGWVSFVENERNRLFSAPGENGICPPPGSPAYENGLIEGHACVQLQLEDGGPNDDDGSTNGIVKDPGAIAESKPANPPVTAPGGNSGVFEWPALALLLMLMPLSFRQHNA